MSRIDGIAVSPDVHRPMAPGFRRGEIGGSSPREMRAGPDPRGAMTLMGGTPPSPPPRTNCVNGPIASIRGVTPSRPRRSARLLAEDPHCAEAVYLLAVISLDRGRSRESYERFGEAAGLAPTMPSSSTPWARRTRPMAGQRTPWPASAGRSHCDRDTSARTTTWAFPRTPGGTFAAARACFGEAIRLNPRYATACNNLGAMLQAQGRLDEAVAHFEEAIRLKPDYAEAHFNPGSAREGAGRPDRGRGAAPGGDPDPAVLRPSP